MNRIAVVGGGISGIAASHYLLKAGHQVVLYERSTAIGGRMLTAELAGRRVAIGGKNVGVEAKLFRAFADEYLPAKFEDHPTNVHREVAGRLLRAKPNSLSTLYRNARGVGALDLWRFSKYYRLVAKAGGRNDFLGNPAFVDISEKHDHRQLSDYFGKKFNELFLRLLTVRSNGAEPQHCYLGNLCANMGAGAMRGLMQLQGDGVQELLDAFERSARLEFRKDTEVTRIVEMAGRFLVNTRRGTHEEESMFDAVVMALPARAAGSLLGTFRPNAKAQLEKIAYYPTALAVVKYSRPIFDSHVSAISFRPSDILFNAGPYGAHDRDTVRYTFAGGAAQDTVDQRSDPEWLVRTAESLLARHVNVTAKDRQAYVYRYFSEGHCAYAPYHHRVINEIDRELANLPMEICGDYVKGGSIEACFMASKLAVERLEAKLALPLQRRHERAEVGAV